MTDMKCPFCGQKMRRTNGTHNKVGVWQCQNSNDPDNVCIASGYLFNDDVLNYINSTHKALEILLFTINRLENQNYKDCAWHLRLAIAKIEAMGIANKALEQITALEQKDVK